VTDAYRENLKDRTRQYALAHHKYPEVRRQEVELMVPRNHLSYPPLRALDWLAGTGVVCREIWANYPECLIHAHEPTKLSLHLPRYALPGAMAYGMDLVTCLTGLHHFSSNDRELHVRAMANRLAPGGILSIADVQEDTNTSYFLAQHAGHLDTENIGEGEIEAWMENAGLEVVSSRHHEGLWALMSDTRTADFIRNLLPMDTDPPIDEARLATKYWGLRYVVGRKPS